MFDESITVGDARGYAGPSSFLFDSSTELYWPVAAIRNARHSQCWASAIKKYPGWESYDVKDSAFWVSEGRDRDSYSHVLIRNLKSFSTVILKVVLVNVKPVIWMLMMTNTTDVN